MDAGDNWNSARNMPENLYKTTISYLHMQRIANISGKQLLSKTISPTP